MSKQLKIRLSSVKKSDLKFLYRLLRERDPIFNISHKKMPSYAQHRKFFISKPYSRWYVIYDGNKKIGTAYLSKQNEIGIHIKKGFPPEKIRFAALIALIKQNPRERYLVNINPRNDKTIDFYKKNGFRLIQYTFELLESDFIVEKNN